MTTLTETQRNKALNRRCFAQLETLLFNESTKQQHKRCYQFDWFGPNKVFVFEGHDDLGLPKVQKQKHYSTNENKLYRLKPKNTIHE